MANANFDNVSTWVVESTKRMQPFDNASDQHEIIYWLDNHDSRVQFEPISTMFGERALVPIIFTAQAAEGRTKAQLYTAQTINETISGAITNAQFEYALHRSYVVLDAIQERRIIAAQGNKESRGVDLLGAEVQRMVTAFWNLLSSDLNTDSVDSVSKVMGIRHPLATDNTVGNIIQSAALPNWQASVTDRAADTFDIDMLITGQSNVSRTTIMGGKERCDLVLLAEQSTGLLFSSAVDAVGGFERVRSDLDFARFGHENLIVMNATVAAYRDGLAGDILFLTSPMFLFDTDEEAQNVNINGPATTEGGTTKTWTYIKSSSLMIGDCRKQGIFTGVSGSVSS